jgi:hypothetical protein
MKAAGKSAIALSTLLVVLALQPAANAGQLDIAGDRGSPLAAGVRVAQDAGGVGGTVGKQDKSATGVQHDDSAKPAPSNKPAPSKKASPKPRKSQDSDDTAPSHGGSASRNADTGGAIPADGAWTGASAGPCIITWHWNLNVNNGVVTGSGNASGQVTRSGTITGNMVVFGQRYDFTGRMVGTKGSGTWTNLGPRGCVGNWTATKS